MANAVPQTFENHARIRPAYHYVAFPLFGVNLCWALYQAVVHFSWANLINLSLALALILLFFLARVMAITVQDRLIRLEMRLRMREVLPSDLQSRISQFSVKQLVALRFAGDDELPELARKVLDEKLEDQKTIKRMVKNWQGDYQRA
jgi:Family of unknown function (DUF6526)